MCPYGHTLCLFICGKAWHWPVLVSLLAVGCEDGLFVVGEFLRFDKKKCVFSKFVAKIFGS